MYQYLQENDDGSYTTIITPEHMLYPWEVARCWQIDERKLTDALEAVSTAKYFYVSRKGKMLRCYRISDIAVVLKNVFDIRIL